ncbi:TPA: O-antigen ligase family protein [Streptococcus suis]
MKIRIVFDKKNIKYFFMSVLVFISFVNFPDYIIGGSVREVYYYCSILIYLLIIITYFKKFRFKINYFQLIVLVFLFIPFFSTLKNGFYQLIIMGKNLLAVFSASLTIQMGIDLNKRQFLKYSTIFWGFLSCINYLTFFIYYPSMSKVESNFYFLGNDNGSVFETICFFSSFFLLDLISKNKLSKKLLLFLLFAFASYLYVRSGNGMACVALLLAIYFIYNNKILDNVISGMSIILSYLVIFYLIVVQRDGGVVALILRLFEKDATYSGRTYIWESCFKYIKLHPFFGNGYEDNSVLLMKMGNIKAHNIIIQNLYNGGLVMLVLFLILLFLVLKKISTVTTIKVKNTMNLFLFTVLLLTLFDYYYSKVSIIYLFSLYYYVSIYKEKVGIE